MKQYYESEVLFQLMERDGFNIPSSVPPYESEIKAYLINQVKQAYPKLTDYEAEWLLYNYTKHLPADFPISSVTNATEATFENVVPFAYQSATLKGNTLVNLLQNAYVSNGVMRNANVSYSKADTTYTLIYNVTALPTTTTRSTFMIDLSNGTKIYQSVSPTVTHKMGINKWVFKTPTDATFSIVGYWSNNEDIKLCADNIVLLEGDYTNVDIPYFEGMQSVKMPVLTTTGKNLFDITKHNLSKDEDGDYIATNYYADGKAVKYNLKKNATYRVTTEDNFFGSSFNLSVNGQWVNINTPSQVIFTTDDSGEYYIRIGSGIYNAKNDKLPKNIQIEEGIQSTSYEPYKSNTLTTPSDLELREIGGVRDELDCLTGEMTQRIGEIVLDGRENWESHTDKTNTKVFSLTIKNLKQIDQHIICDRFPTNVAGDVEKINNMGNVVYVAILKSKADNLEKFKSYLSQNPITVQYLLATESIKTVDLTTVNEKGETTHFMPLEGTMNVQSSGESIQPTFDMSVPVEATTQNLASFIEMEMEE